MGAVFLDPGPMKAFDLVNHILLKTSLYTANSPSVSIFRTYLDHRSQGVYDTGEDFSEGTVRSEYTRDLFLVRFASVFFFINDLTMHITSDTVNRPFYLDYRACAVDQLTRLAGSMGEIAWPDN